MEILKISSSRTNPMNAKHNHKTVSSFSGDFKSRKKILEDASRHHLKATLENNEMTALIPPLFWQPLAMPFLFYFHVHSK